MAFCSKCGSQIADDAAFCPSCGEVNAAAQQASDAQSWQQAGAQPGYQQAGSQQGYQQADPGQGYQQGYGQAGGQAYQQPYPSLEADVQANKVFGILAYLELLVLVTIFAAPKTSKYSRFHANQGLVLMIGSIGCSIVIGIISAILTAVLIGSYAYGAMAIVGLVIGLLYTALGILACVLVIMGIVNAAQGTMKPLPIIGNITILK